ncbi:hypothetical protein NIES2107_72250 (plasmid) [Nostoc carneum NIES-2107]|nr:hypothetical protein NIES2107_72250 [Nostoc carneum NIES-2107]
MTTRVFRGITYTVETVIGDGQNIQGTRGNDWIEAPGSNKFISTGKGNDVIVAGLEVEYITNNYPPYGGQAIVWKTPGVNDKTIIAAGAGDDYVVVGGGNYVIDLGNGNNIFETSGGSNIRLSAGNGNDIIDAGNIGNYQVDAGGGNNWVYLGAGNSCVSAGAGDDIITTNSFENFNQLLTYIFFPEDGTPQPYKQVIDAGNGDNQIELYVFGQTNIRTGSGQDFVLALSLSTSFEVGVVNSDVVDILTGSGNDTVITIDTKSLINTGAGDDLIIAGSGDDTIYAGSGRNVINLRGASISIPNPVFDLGFYYNGDIPAPPVQGGGNDTVYLESGRNTVILGSNGFATIYDFDRNDKLSISGLDVTLSRVGNDTLISSGSSCLGILKEYTGSVALV